MILLVCVSDCFSCVFRRKASGADCVSLRVCFCIIVCACVFMCVNICGLCMLVCVPLFAFLAGLVSSM